MLTIKRSFAYSIAFHITIFIVALLLISPVRDKKGGEFFARLVSPEEFLASRPVIPVIPRARPALPAKPGTFMSKQPAKPGTPMSQPLEKGYSQTMLGQGLSSSQSPAVPASPGQGPESKPEVKGTMQKPNVPTPSLKEKLFDRNIIGDIAKREMEKEEKEGRNFSFDVKELRYLAYLRRLKERIEHIWIYPPDAATRGIYGDLVIKFTIKKNGSLGAVELMRTSGYKSLDDAALRALKDAEPFWPLPDEWGMEAYTIEGHFIYTIYGYYVR
jgi:protein TonB